jgi:hypothetical protein
VCSDNAYTPAWWDEHILGLFRATNVLKYYRGFSFPPSKKFDNYLNKLFHHPAFRATCSTEQLYLDSYERYVRKLASGLRALVFMFAFSNKHTVDMLSIGRTPAK